MKSMNIKLLAALASMGLIGCSQKVEFVPILTDSASSLTKTNEVEITSAQLKVGSAKSTFVQEQWDLNTTSVSFQVVDTNNESVNNVQATDLIVNENGTEFRSFVVNTNSEQFAQTVDIVIALDVTGSMSPTIESAKSRVINFINNTRANGYHTRMCLVTFGDYTVQKCSRFYDNDPSKPETQAQVDELISEVSKLRALKGAEDPGGRTYDENPLSAVIDSSVAPWGNNSQRFMILITDAEFLYSPGNQGEIGSLAPMYTDALEALQSSQMNLFLVAPTAAGYSSTFGGQPSLVTASKGEYFKFDDLINERITLDTVLGRIMQRVRTTYTLNFNVDEIRGLNPGLPLSKRQITVRLADGRLGRVNILNVSSNLPNGRPQIRSTFKLADKAVDPGSVRLRINGVSVSSGFHIADGEVRFLVPPPMGAQIEVEYDYTLLRDRILLQPITIGSEYDVSDLLVKFNGKKATKAFVRIERSIEGDLTITPAETALAEDDPFDIKGNGGLVVQVYKVELAKE